MTRRRADGPLLTALAALLGVVAGLPARAWGRPACAPALGRDGGAAARPADARRDEIAAAPRRRRRRDRARLHGGRARPWGVPGRSRARQTPEQKVDVVRALRARPELRNVVMVGDSVNDAPALALADVGVAIGRIGATISSDTADAVILVDRVTDVVAIARHRPPERPARNRRVARRDGIRRLRLPLARRRRAPAGGDRRRRDRERAPRAPLSRRRATVLSRNPIGAPPDGEPTPGSHAAGDVRR